MAVRAFNGSTDTITFTGTFGNVGKGGNGQSLLLVVKPQWVSGIVAYTSIGQTGTGTSASIYQDAATELVDGADNPPLDSAAILTGYSVGSWGILAMTKPAGTSAATLHWKPLGSGSWIHVAGGTSGADTTFTVNNWKLSGFVNATNNAPMRLAVAAVYNRDLTNAELVAIEAAASTAAINSAGPVEILEFNQAAVTAPVGLKGVATQNSISGTSVVTGDDPTWTFATPQVGTPTTNTGSLTTATTPVPSGLAQDDEVILVISYDGASGATITNPGGFTVLANGFFGTDGQRYWIGWKRQGATPDSGTYSHTFSGGAPWASTAIPITGRDTTNPPVLTAITTNTSAVATATANGFTASANDVGLFINIPDAANSTPVTHSGWSAPFTEIVDLNNASGFASIGVAKAEYLSAGATGAPTASMSPSSAYSAWLLQLPVVASGGATQSGAGTLAGTSSVTAAGTVSGLASAAGQMGWGTMGAGNMGASFGASGSVLSGAATLAGNSTLTVAGRVEKLGAATLAGSSFTDTLPLDDTLPSNDTLGASGTFSAQVVAGGANGSATLAGNSTFTAAGLVEKRGAATLAGTSGATLTGQITRTAAATFVGSSTETVAGIVERRGASTLAGSTTVSLTAQVEARATSTQAGSSGVTINGSVERRGAATLNGTSGATLNGGLEARGAVTLAGTSGASIDGSVTKAPVTGAATLAGSSTFSAAGLVERLGAVTFVGSTTVTATANEVLGGAASLNGISGGTFTGYNQKQAAATLAGNSGASLAGLREVNGASTESATTTIAAGGQVTKLGAATLAGTSGGTFAGQVTKTGASTLSGASTLAAGANEVFGARATLIGLSGAAITGDIKGLQAGVATLVGASGATLTANVIYLGSSTLGGSTTLTASGVVERRGASILAGNTTLTAAGRIERLGSTTMVAFTGATVSGRREVNGSLTASAITAVSAASSREVRGSVTESATTSLFAAPNLVAQAQATLNGVSDLIASGGLEISGSATFDGFSGMTARLPGNPIFAAARFYAWSTVTAKAAQPKDGIVIMLGRSFMTAKPTIAVAEAKLISASSLYANPSVASTIHRQRRVFAGYSRVGGSRVRGGVR